MKLCHACKYATYDECDGAWFVDGCELEEDPENCEAFEEYVDETDLKYNYEERYR